MFGAQPRALYLAKLAVMRRPSLRRSHLFVLPAVMGMLARPLVGQAPADHRTTLPKLRVERDDLTSRYTRTVRFETTQGTAMNVDVSPDGKTIVFDLLGDLYTVPISGGSATRLTSGPAFDTEPVFSPDGKRIAFVSDRSGSNNVWLMDADGRRARAFTHETATPVQGPEWVRAGAFRLAVRKAGDYWLYRADGSSTALSTLVVEGTRLGTGYATWSHDGRFLYRPADGRGILRIDVARGISDPLIECAPTALRSAISPDGQWLVFAGQRDNQTGLRVLNVATQHERWLIYPLPDRDNSTLQDGTSPSLPRLAFLPDGTAIILATGGTLQRLDLRSGRMRPIRFRAIVEQELGLHMADSLTLVLSQPRAEPAGSVAFEGATVITMRGHEVLQNATVLVTGRRIAAVGRRGSIVLPSDVRRIDVAGKTIIPGLIDLRGEVPLARHLSVDTNLTLAANLAFGVTTVRAVADGGGASEALAAAARYVGRLETGAMTGARLFAAGAVTAVEAARITSLEAARALVQRQRALGATAIVQRASLVRRQRQWIAMAARESGLPLIGESGDLRRALTMVIDGYHTIQGTIPSAQLYDDVRRLLAASQAVYIPTLLAATGGRPGAGQTVGTAEEYFLETTDIHNDSKARQFGLSSPGAAAWRLSEDYHFLRVGRQAARLAALGVPVAVGTAGRHPGLGVHWELWALEMSGFSAHDALRAATATAAEVLGLGHELGTIEVGKVADLVVLDADPLADLRHSRAARYVMQNGELFDASTLAMIWPRTAPPPPLRDTSYDPPALMRERAESLLGGSVAPRASGSTAVRTAAGTEGSIPPPARQGESLPIMPARTIAFETDDGSYMNVDLSPDGRTIVFNLLGDIYTVPASGGAATRLTHGLGVDTRPVWSPDGTQIAYVSDAGGAEALWVMAADGGNPRPVVGERTPADPNYTFKNVEWVPDGQALVSDDTVYSLTGGKRLVLPDLAEGPVRSVRFSPDGRYVYFRQDGVGRHDRTTGETIQLARPPVAFGQPVVSPDGRWLAYVTDGNPYNGLRIRNLATGEDRWLAYPIDRDRFGANYERYAFTPDSRALLIGYGGKLHRIDVTTGQDRIIAFTAAVQAELGPFVYHRFRVTNDSLTVRYIRSPAVSPDGKTLAFVALQRLYTMALPDGTPKQLVPREEGQFDPAYSPDGRWIAYVTWSDTAGGHVWRVPAEGGTPERLTSIAAYYQWPAWSPDGTTLAILKGGTRHFRPEHDSESNDGWLQILPSTGGTPRTVRAGVSRQQPAVFTPDAQRLFVREGGQLGARERFVSSIRLDGRDRRVLARVDVPDYPRPMVPSPDGRYLAYVIGESLYLARLPATPESVLLGKSSGAVPVVRLAYGALDPRWHRGGKMLTWVVGNRVFRLDPERAMARAVPEIVAPIHLTAPRHIARGTIAFRGARVITMRGDEVIENATLVITNDRITALGPAASIPIPRGATILDVSGKTIMPGLVDLHAHFARRGENFIQHDWGYLTWLAYGVTTARDPLHRTTQFGDAELVETGQLLGPRVFTAGERLPRVESLDEARSLVEYHKMMGGIVVKQDQPTRRQRQWVVQAAAEVGLNVTNEGRDLHLQYYLDGGTGVEHHKNTIFYGDVTRLMAEAKTWLTPTMVSYGGWAQPYFRDRYRWMYREPKYRRFVPYDEFLVYRRSGVLQQPGDPDYKRFLGVVRLAADIVHQGGHVTIGSHGDDPGLGVHWDLWALQMGGLTNHEALRAATLHGAEGLGLQQDLGSLEVGKIADLLVLDRNPLENIEHTLAIRYVMKNGILYDGNTLDTLWPIRERLPAWMVAR